MTDQLVERYETNDGEYRLPLYLQEEFDRLGYTYRSAGCAVMKDAGPFAFRGEAGISGTVSSRDVMTGVLHGLVMEIHTASPRTDSQEEAVNRLLLQLPMFAKVEMPTK